MFYYVWNYFYIRNLWHDEDKEGLLSDTHSTSRFL